MITGLREFRKKLSEYTNLVKRGQIVIITDRDKPIASFISPDKLRDLAKKTNDNFILAQLKEAQVDKNKEFLKRKNEFRQEIMSYLKEAKEGSGRVPESVISKLQAISYANENIISDDGTIEDQRMLDLLRRKSHDPISRVLDYDYYHVHQDFIDKLKIEMLNLVQITSQQKNGSNISKDLKLLADMIENAVIRKKSEKDNSVKPSCSVLIRVTKNGEFYSSRIYTIMPYWYEKPRKFNYFLDTDHPLSVRLIFKKVGHKFDYQKYQYEIVSIT
jgi:antitoxin (DNA-binding transcriptional repressor) of toxin-antitoxin stability system/transcription elongation GreA/GreB family factor